MLSLSRNALLRHVTPAPPNWTVAFGRQAPLEVDLGCGRGTYPWLRATRYPEVNVVALELRKKWLQQIRSQCEREKVTNLRAIRCDISEDLPVLFAPRSVGAFTIHHPDPWWKKRHRKRRLLQPDFAALLVDLLVPGGWIFAQTDVPDLAEEMQAALAACPRLSRVDAELFRQSQLLGLYSHREKKCLELRIPVSRMVYRTRSDPEGSA